MRNNLSENVNLKKKVFIFVSKLWREACEKQFAHWRSFTVLGRADHAVYGTVNIINAAPFKLKKYMP